MNPALPLTYHVYTSADWYARNRLVTIALGMTPCVACGSPVTTPAPVPLAPVCGSCDLTRRKVDAEDYGTPDEFRSRLSREYAYGFKR